MEGSIMNNGNNEGGVGIAEPTVGATTETAMPAGEITMAEEVTEVTNPATVEPIEQVMTATTESTNPNVDLASAALENKLPAEEITAVTPEASQVATAVDTTPASMTETTPAPVADSAVVEASEQTPAPMVEGSLDPASTSEIMPPAMPEKKSFFAKLFGKK